LAHEGLWVVIVDARSLNFDQAFDLCFSNATLHWVDNHQAFLNGASRSLRRGGQLVISCGGQGNAVDVLRIFSELSSHESWQRHFDGFHNPYFFYGNHDYSLWLEKTEYIPESERDNFITCFVETYLESIPLDQNGLAHVRMVRLEVSAIKS
jgi:SAM-dependent methyltransferase